MRKKSMDIAVVAMFLALTAIFQILRPPLGYVSPWGISIDLVALPVLLAFFLYGFRISLAVCVGMFFILSVVAPEGVLGASMKWIATMPMIITPALMSLKFKKDIRKDVGVVIAALISMVSLIALMGIMYDLVGARENELYSPIIVLISTVAFYSAFYIVSRNHGSQGISFYSNSNKIIIALVLALFVRGITTTVINYYFTFPIFFDIPTAAAIDFIPWYAMFGLNVLQGTLEVAVAWLLVFRTKMFAFAQKAYIRT